MPSLHPKYWSVCRVETGDATLVVAGRNSGHVEVWHPGVGGSRKIGRVKGPALAVCPVRLRGQPVVVSAGIDRTIWLWDPVTRRQVTRYTGHPTERITQLCRLPAPAATDDDRLVTAGHDGNIIVLDITNGEAVHIMTEPAGPVQGMCLFELDETHRLATASLDAAVRIFDVESGALLHTMTGHEGWVHAVCPVTVNGEVLIASGGDDGIIRLWDPQQGTMVRTMKPRPSLHTAGIEMSGGGTIFALREVHSDNGTWLAAGGDFPGVWLWDATTGRGAGWVGWGGALDTKPECGWVRALATYPSETGPHLLICGYDKAVNLFTANGDHTFQSF
ncbi:hypothetical protein [Actinomadura sp. 7K534]|uniref:WD40 repeat domain-containing protein n=1 Tax=Actinomadura sp. 7K534 TaxID=2530366 RepID=UPI001404DA15|nr:hypothetical protein [Actinomadura sp. 7K534]